MHMTRLDRRWAKARTVPDLAGLTADWLEGRLPGGHPGGYDRPDEETTDLVPDLARLNRAGWATDCSQPGESGPRWDQRAAVDGWVADDRLCDEIAHVADGWGLIVVRQSDEECIGPDTGVPVTRAGGRAETWFGRRLAGRDLRHSLPGLHRRAYRALDGATYLTVVDPAWGRADRLWHVLDRAVR